MRRRTIGALTALALLAAGGAACNGSSTPDKIVINEQVCQNARFLRMTLNKEYRVVLDNDRASPGQLSMSFKLDTFPAVVTGDVPRNSTIGDPTSTIVLVAEPGDEQHVDIIPTFAGDFIAVCGIVSGTRTSGGDVNIQVVP